MDAIVPEVAQVLVGTGMLLLQALIHYVRRVSIEFRYLLFALHHWI